jgi:transcriptional regulator with XRE-family HTH domain
VNDHDARDVRKKFKDRIAELRQLSGKTLEQFGAALGISAHGAAQIERGEVFPIPERFEQIATFMRVEVMDLFDSRPERKMPPLVPKERKPRRVVRKQRSPGSRKNSNQE